MLSVLMYFFFLYIVLGVAMTLMVLFVLNGDDEVEDHFTYKTMLVLTLFWLPLFVRIWWKSRKPKAQ